MAGVVPKATGRGTARGRLSRRSTARARTAWRGAGDVGPSWGAGLAVVKRVVDDHGWSIVVDSQLGKGATFRVVIPSLSGRSV